MNPIEARKTLYKVVTWRLISISVTMALLFVVTGDLKRSSIVTLVLHLFLTFFHFIFEVLWEKLMYNKDRKIID